MGERMHYDADCSALTGTEHEIMCMINATSCTRLGEDKMGLNRRTFVSLGGTAGALAIGMPFIRPSYAQSGPLKLGVLLPYSGTYAPLGEAITRAMELYVKQQGGKLAGRDVTFVKLDDESAPPKATELT